MLSRGTAYKVRNILYIHLQKFNLQQQRMTSQQNYWLFRLQVGVLASSCWGKGELAFPFSFLGMYNFNIPLSQLGLSYFQNCWIAGFPPDLQHQHRTSTFWVIISLLILKI